MMIERRNFYRILHVQPDAPMAVITESYRVLMQKLNIRADLNNPDWNASLLNIAYNTLRDPVKRAAYDRELLKRYHIRVLSQGALGSKTEAEVESARIEQPSGLNQSNYIPEFVAVENGKENDMVQGRKFQFPSGSIVVFDKGYVDYQWYANLTAQNIGFAE